jgi:hypothetical protein
MNLVERAKAILLTPQKEWPVIEAESATVASLYTGYIIPLAAIPAVASFIGLSVFGFGGILRVPFGIGLEAALIRYVATLVGVFILALIIDALAPTFGGTKSQIQALKLAAYSSTASWLAGIFMILPALGILAIVGLYSLYLLFVGLPVMMKSPQEKSMGYTVVVILAAIVLFAVVGAVTSRVMGFGRWY